MIAEGREIAKLHKNMVVKIPMTVEGLKACKVLSSEGSDIRPDPDHVGLQLMQKADILDEVIRRLKR